MTRLARQVFLALAIVTTALMSREAAAQRTASALNTDGSVFMVDMKTGALTPTATFALSGYNLGATARKGSKFYFVAPPSGSTANMLYTVSLRTGVASSIPLDRQESVRALFFNGKKLFALFYDGTSGVFALARVNARTGGTTTVLDLSTLDAEPLPGALVIRGGTAQLLTRPETDSSRRQLLSLRITPAKQLSLSEVTDAQGGPVRCDNIATGSAENTLLCLASNADESAVQACMLTGRGRARCKSPFAGILRLGSGHTLLRSTGKSYYAFVYAPGEPNNQRIIEFTASGALKRQVVLSTIMLGAHFE